MSIVEDISDQIGERLTKAREVAGLTVDDVMFKTRIPRSVINALEAGDFSVFSSPTYAKSFLSQYSGYLNVDARLWLDALEPASFIGGDAVRPLWEAAPVRDEPVSSPREGNTGWASAVTMMAATGVMVFVALKGYEFFEKRFGLELAPPVPAAVAPVAPQPTVAPSAPVAKPESVQHNRSADDPPPPPPRAIIVR